MLNKLLFLLGLTGILITAGNSNAQKIYYSPGNEDWEEGSPGPDDTLIYSVFLIGDLKYPDSGNNVLNLLEREISAADKSSAVVFLGDLIYPAGLPDSSDKGYPKAEKDISHILSTLKGFRGEVIFLPGNHDWINGKKPGWASVLNEEKYTEQHYNSQNVYHPDGGCPGPVEISLSDDITLIVFDAQWWFQKNIKPDIRDCDYEDIDDLFTGVEDAIRRNSNKKIIFATHHPLYSVGYHGGHFPESYLLFPLLEFKNWLYLPLPGFLYTGYRKYLGHIQDLAHPEYKILVETLLNIFGSYTNIIYAAGHEHNLQYFGKDSLHHIVSGGGGEGTYIARRKKKTDFAADQTGFSRLDFYASGDVWLEFKTPVDRSTGKVLYKKRLFNKPVFKKEEFESTAGRISYSDSIVRISLTEIYQKGKFTRFWMGDNYRDIWNTKVTLPVFDISKEKGGLTIIKRGGGQQTRSIRMENPEGRQYVLRSVNKYVGGALDESLQGTIAEGVVQDGVSASNPFGAVSIPKMADAAGVMHTNPKMVWVPDDPELGIYQKDIANGAFIFEERPDGDWSDSEEFGGSHKIVSTDKVIDKIKDEHDHRVDQLSVVNARLFDIFLADWDRHDDQWRWAAFKRDGITSYRPVPRDRDQVYFVNEGVLMELVSLSFIMPKFQGFDQKIKKPKGLGFNARYFDRSFMTEPNIGDWTILAEEMKNNLTDSIIHEAISSFPEEVYNKHGEIIENRLRSRRDQLPEYALKYYKFLSKAVDVVGTDGRELFEVRRLDDDRTTVNVYARSKEKGKTKELIYHRRFYRDYTREIRLYGLDGEDMFTVGGQVKKGIKIRIIGGKETDTIIDYSRVRGPGKKTIVYDRKDKNNYFRKGRETKLKLANDKEVNKYDRKQFKFNKVMPLLAVGFNIDDGIFIGGGASFKSYNFRDSTFHRVTGKIALRTAAFGISYRGLISSISRYFNLILDADISMPRNVDYFYGLGNNTEKLNDDSKYYRVRYSYAWANPQLKHEVNSSVDYSFGAFYQYFKVTDTADRFIGEISYGSLDSTAYLGHHYTGLNASLEIDTRDNDLFPVRGVTWITEARGFYSIREDGKNFLKLRSDLGIYLSFRRDPRIVFAFRFGGALNFGEYEFFHANFLGQKSNLRGFRNNRFAGDHTFYQNTEIRFKVLNFKNYIFNGETGFLVFNDIGRVWLKGEESSRWHNGFGAGIWLIPFEMTVLTVSYEHSREENLVTFSFRFMF